MTAGGILSASNLHLWRGDRHVLRGVSLSVAAGEILHVTGPNGAGKTSLLRVICGLLQPEEGDVQWQGVSTHAADSRFLGALAYLGHETALKGDLTALENLRFSVGLTRAVNTSELRAMLEQLGVAHCADLPCRVLSAGQRRRVALARVLLSGATLWVLDEPFTNLDSASSEQIARALAAHTGQGGLALIAAHQALAHGGVVKKLELS